ncbi:hypothetical protein DB44_DZ00200 [Candidatus Protochlamydia amoebophila]|uniref:Uncharacterized protein n=1 Tax=Candidatus Protochlamydia amoebophila TaxID=362787 RepID=A0A0C1JVM2_9BACT|nr:hypothetical protein DB44_DZ00200 [Candidatus Protochlamydia amoebophila]
MLRSFVIQILCILFKPKHLNPKFRLVRDKLKLEAFSKVLEAKTKAVIFEEKPLKIQFFYFSTQNFLDTDFINFTVSLRGKFIHGS